MTKQPQLDAIACKSQQKAILAPSFDGQDKILIELTYNDKKSSNRYFGAIYDFKHNSFTDNVPVQEIWNSFDFSMNIPHDLTDILKVSSIRLYDTVVIIISIIIAFITYT
jgi:hypothetical protein